MEKLKEASKISSVPAIDGVIRRRQSLINMFMLALIVAILFYVVFLYGVAPYIGIYLGIWN